MAHRPKRFAVWLTVIAVCMLPAAMTVLLGGAKFNPGRLVISLFFFPALFVLFRNQRRFLPADFLSLGIFIWIVGATLLVSGHSASLSSAAAQALEFGGGYIVARAYCFGNPALRAFCQALKTVVVIIIILAVTEQISGRHITYDSIATLWGQPTKVPEIRDGFIRAMSTFPHSILYGTFCAVAAAIFIYSESAPLRRWVYVGLCLFGCILSFSSAPIMSAIIVGCVYCYDRLMRRHLWRWRALVAALIVLLVSLYFASNNLISWIVAHLTLDPSTGYFRQATWNRAFYNIGESPFFGYGFDAYGDPNEFFDSASVDSVWLVMALRFGIPVVMLLAALNFMAFARREGSGGGDCYANNMRTGFTLALVIFMFSGLTVHFWNSIWILWGLCIGIRASLQEQVLRQPVSARIGVQPSFKGTSKNSCLSRPVRL
jgi:hypothetical protein